MEKPWNRAIEAQNDEAIIKAGEESRQEYAKECMGQFIALIKETLPEFPEATYNEQCQKIHMMEKAIDILNADVQRILRKMQ